MRVFFCLLLLLPACASHHAVRCDGRLQPVNLPIAGAVSGVAAEVTPAAASPQRVP